jgi:methylglyoxal synthase
VKTIGLVAHDLRKETLLRWVAANRERLAPFRLCGTGTTGSLVAEVLDRTVDCFLSGPLGGDLQLGAEIAEGKLDLLIFFWDPLAAQPHDPDVRALLRVAVLWNIPFACNEATADFLLTSTLIASDYNRRIPDFSRHNSRLKPIREEVRAKAEAM